jgi:hypothetical protein
MQAEHIAVMVTSNTVAAHEMATRIYESMAFLVSPIIDSYNEQRTFFIAPSGSYKDHTGAAASETYRERFKEWCRANKADYAQINVGYQKSSVEVFNKKITKSVAAKKVVPTLDLEEAPEFDIKTATEEEIEAEIERKMREQEK